MNELNINIAAEPTPEQLVSLLFGINAETLTAQILENRDGRFDRLYRAEASVSDARPETEKISA